MKWNLVPLGTVCTVSSSKRIFAKEYRTEGIPFYRGKEVIEKHKGNPVSTELFISKERYEEIRCKYDVPQIGDILLTSVGTLGVSWLVDETEFYFKDGNLTWLRAKDGLLNKFLYLWLNSDDAKHQIDMMCIGSTQKALTIETINKFVIPLPSMQEQESICAVIYPIIERIKNNRNINDNLYQQALALYRSLFVDFERIPAAERVASELGDIPVGWGIKTLSEVTTNIRTRVREHSYKVLSALNSGCLQSSEEYFTKQVFSKDISNYIVVDKNDFAYNPARVNIGSIGLNTLGYIGCVSPVYVVFRTEPEYHYFMDFFIKSARFKEEVRVRASGSVRQSMNYTDFGLIKIAYPPLAIVRQFNAEYEIIVKCINRNLEENVALASIRDSLIPKLLAGEIDLSSVTL